MASLLAVPAFAQDEEVIPPLPLFVNGYTEASMYDGGQGDNYNDFLSQQFYGALAMSKDGYSYWYAGFHDMEAARVAVLAWCEDDSPAEGLPCELAAYLVPAYIPDGFVHGLSASAINEFNEFMTYGSEKSFAVSANGAYSYTWDYGSSFEADREAINLCNESAQGKSDWVIGQSHGCTLYDFRGASADVDSGGDQLLQRPTKK